MWERTAAPRPRRELPPRLRRHADDGVRRAYCSRRWLCCSGCNTVSARAALWRREFGIRTVLWAEDWCCGQRAPARHFLPQKLYSLGSPGKGDTVMFGVVPRGNSVTLEPTVMLNATSPFGRTFRGTPAGSVSRG